MLARKLLCLLVGTALFSNALGQSCNSTAASCSECISSGPLCAWCSDAAANYTTRCRTDTEWSVSSDKTCPSASLMNPTPSTEVVENLPLSGADDAQVQVQPQRFKVKLRPGSSQTVQFSVQPAPNYPLDVYYLMDLSFSMSDDLQILRNQSLSLATALNSVSTNSYLGFGSFVEKPLEPYSLAYGTRPLQPCGNCDIPYSYRNVFPLSTSREAFSEALSNVIVSANVDEPEDSLTALVQAAVCKNQVGWKDRSRKVVVVASDAGYHMAGEGRLGGVILPHDGRCHLVDNKEYSAHISRTMDYPSIGLVRRVLEENRVTAIFAVTADLVPIYKALSERLPGSVVLELESNSNNAVTILREELAKQVSITNLTILAHNGGVNISATASCPVGNAEIGAHGLPLCRNMSVSTAATFTVTLTGTTCDKLSSIGQVTLRIQGFDDVIVDVESLVSCQCPCLNKPLPADGSPFCRKDGALSCGTCPCYENFRSVDGGLCNCNETAGDEPCRSADGQVCNGRGDCVCGKCQCTQDESDPQKVICGDFCECDNQMCPSSDGLICGGAEQGECQCSSENCGQCLCKPGFNGTDCSCPLSTDACIRDGEQRVCSGEGICVCGKCTCLNGYDGTFCEICPLGGCQSLCDRSLPCVSCSNNNSPTCAACNANVSRQISAGAVDDSSGGYEIDGIQATACQQNCESRYYVAQDNEGNLRTIHIDRSSDSCPTSVDYVPIIIGIIIGMLLLGILALILWKLWARWKDRKEYHDFLTNRNKQEWEKDESPLFKAATVTYPNPQYKLGQQGGAGQDGSGASQQQVSNF